jgi:hypothetical protein
VIKAFLNLCLILFLDTLAYMVAIVAAAAVAWAAVCGARWIFAGFQKALMALCAGLRKERFEHAGEEV